MASESVYLLAKRLETDINKPLQRVDLQDYAAAVRKSLVLLKREAADMRLDARDYELAETRAEQSKLASEVRKRLEAVQKNILAASQHDIFNVIEVAELSAHIDRLSEQLE